jgi:subtilase family serine protease
MTQMRFFSFGALAALAATALPLMAQSADSRPVDPADPGWAHPPIVVMPRSADSPAISGYSPAQVTTGYGLTSIANKGAGQTIALIDAYNNPDAASDLTTFSTQFGLPACTTTNGCFKVIYASGTQPRNNRNWSGESSLDIEWSHAIAPQAKIILVEAASASNAALFHAVDVAVANGATVVSMSFSGSEFSTEINDDSHFSVTGVVFCASSGDDGHGVGYPAASPNVVAVGGTTLNLNSGGTWLSETAWSGSGGGESAYESEPSYQASAQSSGKRGVPDVAWDANPSTGVAIYSKYGFGGWVEVGGTSVSSPSWAGLFAIANSSRVAASKGQLTLPQVDLYPDAETDYHDITSGTNGSCGALCTAGTGYDFVTGVGSPKANLLVPALVAAP